MARYLHTFGHIVYVRLCLLVVAVLFVLEKKAAHMICTLYP